MDRSGNAKLPLFFNGSNNAKQGPTAITYGMRALFTAQEELVPGIYILHICINRWIRYHRSCCSCRENQVMSLVFEIIPKIEIHIEYRICANKPPAVYKKIKVLSWWLIEIFPKAKKSPKKWTFWGKKAMVYLNFV